MNEITPREVGLGEVCLPCSSGNEEPIVGRLIGDNLQIDRVEYPEKAEKGEMVTVRMWGLCHADPLMDCEGYVKFIRHDTGETIRVPVERWTDVPRNQTKLFVMPSFKMPSHDVLITIEPWEHDPWPGPDDPGTPRDITIELWEYTFAEFASFEGERGPFAPGKTGKIAECVVRNIGNKRGSVRVSCYDHYNVKVDSWSVVLDPGSSTRGSLSAPLPNKEGTYTYTATCYGEDQTEGEGDQRTWSLTIVEDAPPPPPPGPPPGGDWMDPLDTFIRAMERIRPKPCPIVAIETSWYDFTEKVIEITPAIRILPPV